MRLSLSVDEGVTQWFDWHVNQTAPHSNVSMPVLNCEMLHQLKSEGALKHDKF
jgi:hypothetical protein